MFVAPINTDLLLSEAEKENLYAKLIEQLNKDFNFANEAVDFPQSTTPYELKVQLHEKIYRLIQYKYTELRFQKTAEFRSWSEFAFGTRIYLHTTKYTQHNRSRIPNKFYF